MKLRIHHLFCAALFKGKGYSSTFISNMQSVVDRLFYADEEDCMEKSFAIDAEEDCMEKLYPIEEEDCTEKPFAMDAEEHSAEKIELCTTPDLICSECPNLVEGVCSLDDNNVVSKDIRLAKALLVEPGRIYQREELIRIVAKALSEEMFEDSCRKCRWYEEGLCSYHLLRERYRNAVDKISMI